MFQNSNIEQIRSQLINQLVEIQYYLLRVMNGYKYNFN
jgi:hypothetical protein